MKTLYTFNHEHYHNALKSQINSQHLPLYSRQRGGGLGGIISGMTQYVIPVARKYIIPEIKNAAIRTFDDVLQGTPIPNAVLANTKLLIESVARDISQSQLNQNGGNITRKRKATSYKPVVQSKRNRTSNKNKKKSKNTCTSRCKTKRDIFA